eukprot:6172381-Pleurochrysis_carterae.AAC.6
MGRAYGCTAVAIHMFSSAMAYLRAAVCMYEVEGAAATVAVLLLAEDAPPCVIAHRGQRGSSKMQPCQQAAAESARAGGHRLVLWVVLSVGEDRDGRGDGAEQPHQLLDDRVRDGPAARARETHTHARHAYVKHAHASCEHAPKVLALTRSQVGALSTMARRRMALARRSKRRQRVSVAACRPAHKSFATLRECGSHAAVIVSTARRHDSPREPRVWSASTEDATGRSRAAGWPQT